MTEKLQIISLAINIIGGIASLLAGFLGYKGQKGSEEKEQAKKRHIAKLVIFIIAGIFGLYLITGSTYYFTRKHYEKKADIQRRLGQYRDQFYHDILFKYANLIDNPQVTFKDTCTLLFQSENFFRKTLSLIENGSNEGIKIFKNDYLCYLSVIISTLQQDKDSTRVWADSCLYFAKITFDSIDKIKKKYRQDGKNLKNLLDWIKRDDLENRLHYLWAWALAVKILNGENIALSDIVRQITDIRQPQRYLREYPLSYNYYFRRLRDRFSEDFRNRYFIDPDNHQ